MNDRRGSLTIIDDEIFCNKNGSVRLQFVRDYFGLNLSTKNINEILRLYVLWRDTVEFLPLKLFYSDYRIIDLNDLPVNVDKWIDFFNTNTGKTAIRLTDNPNCNIVSYEGVKTEWVLKKSCKRGNDVYIKQLKHKFKPLINSNKNKTFFSTFINSKRKRVLKTKMLYITGTCDQKKAGSHAGAWASFGAYWNTFITNLRGQFGHIDYIRAYQSQDNGFPHFHALIYFHEFDFSVTRWFNEKKKKWEFRITTRQQLNKTTVRKRLKNAWKLGNLDILCVDNTKDAFTDLLKYVTRDLSGKTNDLTNALIWYFGKQSFGISKNFFSIFSDEIDKTSFEPNDDDLIKAEGVIQSSNSNLKLIKIEVFPTIRADILPNFTQTNIYNFDRPPDPSPETINFLENYIDDCSPSSFKKKSLEDGNIINIVIYKRK